MGCPNLTYNPVLSVVKNRSTKELTSKKSVQNLHSVYSYGFNGMEMDDELKDNKGTSYDFGARMYDPRVGRWFSIDALFAKYPSITPYAFAGNSPISCIDHKGDDIYIVINGVAYNIKNDVKAYGSDEVKQMAYYTLKATVEGKRLLDKYKNSSTTDVYIAIGDVSPPDESIIQAHTAQVSATRTMTTTYSDGRKESSTETVERLPKDMELPSSGDHDVFAGVKTQNAGRNVFVIVINEDYLSGSLTLGKKPDRYTTAAVLYHEIRAHIEMSVAVNSEVEKQLNALPIAERTQEKKDELTDKISHEKYGSYGSPSLTSEPTNFTDTSGDSRWKKPAWTIFRQLSNLRTKNIEKSKNTQKQKK